MSERLFDLNSIGHTYVALLYTTQWVEFVYSYSYWQSLLKHTWLVDFKVKVKQIAYSTVIHYLKNKVGVVDFANAQGVVMF